MLSARIILSICYIRAGKVDVVYIDCARALDTGSLAILISKLNNITLNNNLVTFLSRYLKYRKQFVHYRGVNGKLV